MFTTTCSSISNLHNSNVTLSIAGNKSLKLDLELSSIYITGKHQLRTIFEYGQQEDVILIPEENMLQNIFSLYYLQLINIQANFI